MGATGWGAALCHPPSVFCASHVASLHVQVTRRGSLDLESTRFIVGEVVSALASVHQAGFVFGDLKPENILVTATGHAKITDFGAVRP